ncbi:MAG: phenylalanine--tRNA ligase subunit alpha [Coriobacteriia bacterium]
MGVLEDLRDLREHALARIAEAASLEELEQVRVSVLGRKGSLTAVLRGLGALDPEERPKVGKESNAVRAELESVIESRRDELAAAETAARLSVEAVDVTLPERRRAPGRRHLIEQIVAEITDIFIGLGYQVAEGPQVETDFYNFEALNHPPDHPARSLQDTLYVEDLSGDVATVAGESDVLLRTHTSPVQIRAMEKQRPPLYIIAPGRVFRRDVADPSHTPQFTQVEGLVVDKDITFGDLKGTLEHFVHQMFGADRGVRLRPHFFPFTEPSAELDVSCIICDGAGCRFCGGTGWLEILGCGMVDPNVFGFVDVDPEEWTGFAFGMGVERIAALKYGLDDIRLLLEGDMRFLRQF